MNCLGTDPPTIFYTDNGGLNECGIPGGGTDWTAATITPTNPPFAGTVELYGAAYRGPTGLGGEFWRVGRLVATPTPEPSLVLRSVDGGASWTQHKAPCFGAGPERTDHLYGISFILDSPVWSGLGVVVGTDASHQSARAYVLRPAGTGEDCDDWQRDASPLGVRELLDVACLELDGAPVAYAVGGRQGLAGNEGVVMKWDPFAGKHEFEAVYSIEGPTLRTVEVLGATAADLQVFAGGDDGCLVLFDGVDGEVIQSQTSKDIVGLSFPDASHGWATATPQRAVISLAANNADGVVVTYR